MAKKTQKGFLLFFWSLFVLTSFTATFLALCHAQETTSLWRKYIGIFDVPISLFLAYIGGGNLLVARSEVGLSLAWKALQCHASQFVWFRKLFLLFSRYIHVNTLHVQVK
jgi:hypothetical protein